MIVYINNLMLKRINHLNESCSVLFYLILLNARTLGMFGAGHETDEKIQECDTLLRMLVNKYNMNYSIFYLFLAF